MSTRLFTCVTAAALTGLLGCGASPADSGAGASRADAVKPAALRDAATVTVMTDLPGRPVIASPLTISGTADNRLFGEGVFPVRLLGANGCILAEAPAIPTTEWTTPGQVGFTATLTFSATPGSAAILSFEQDIIGEDPLPPLAVLTLVRVVGEAAPGQEDANPADCPATAP